MGARRRLPVHPLHPNLRTLGTLAVLIALLATVVNASQASAQIEGNAYTGENFDWTIEWDEQAWDLDKEDNSGNSDFVVLRSRDEYASTLSLLATEDSPDIEECVNQWAEIALTASGSGDYVQLADTNEIDIRPGGAAAVFQYDVVGQTSIASTASYVQCFPLTDDVVLRVGVLTDLGPREATFAAVEDVLRTLETSDPDGGIRAYAVDQDGDRGEADADEDVNATQDNINTRLGDEESTETGVDGNEYVSPTYGFTVEWNEDVWTADPDEELINEIPNDLALDRLVLDTETASLYIEGRTDSTDGDMVACVDVELDLLRANDEVSNVRFLQNAHSHPIAGKTVHGAFVAVSFTLDDTNLTGYIECRPIDEGESVLVITMVTKASDFQDAVPDMEVVTGTIQIPLRATAM